MKNKKAIEMGFDWIFAIIAGIFILFLAIYGASKFIKTSEYSLYTETAAQLISLLDPFETGLASGKSAEINFKKETKIYFDCDENDDKFGKQTIAFSEKTFGDKYGEKGGRVNIKNKYIFSEDILEGKKLNLFSKPFFMGFKVADVIVISSENYCFYDTSEEIKEDIEGLKISNVVITNSSSEKCNGIRVCFNSNKNCDIKVNEQESYVIKNGKKLYYIDNLIYGAIFSPPEIYECNVKRLKNKFDELSLIYIGKIKIIERQGCSSNIGAKLNDILGKIDSSRNLILLSEKINEIDLINKGEKSGCRLY